MAKNNSKGDFLKSEEVVCIPNTKSPEDISPKKTILGNNMRRTMTVRSTSVSIEVSKVPKTMPMVPITYGVSTSVQADKTAACELVSPVDVIPSTSPVVRQAKQSPNRVQHAVKRANTSPVKAKKFFTTSALQKQEGTSNGQAASSSSPNATGRRRSIPSGLTITPISAGNATSTNVVAQNTKVICKPAQSYFVSSIPQDKDVPPRIAPKPAVISKEAFYSNKIVDSPSATCYTPGTKCVVLAATPVVAVMPATRGRPKGSRNKVSEPVCLTISSDDDEPSDDAMESSPNGAALTSPALCLQQVTNLSQQTVFLNNTQVNNTNRPMITQIGKASLVLGAGDEDEDLDEEMLEEEEVEEEEDDVGGVCGEELYSDELLNSSTSNHIVLKCRSIRIGSFKIHPLSEHPHILVYLSCDGFKFQIPTVKSLTDMVTIQVRRTDIQQVLGHFGRCLPILFIFNTSACGERIRKQLHMTQGEVLYFDPDGLDDRQKIITFLIDAILDEHRNFLRSCFPGEGVLKEVDQKVANEILVKSTPQHNQAPTHASVLIRSSPVTFPATPIIVPNALTTSVVISTVPVKPVVVQQNPVTKVLTYPPPPQTGGIAITSDDLLCLDEGEFLNDAIIDFYLKYLMNEKLSESDRQRTHIFNSFFYPHLTNVSSSRSGIRLRSGEECSNSMSAKRHAQVRTWTKTVDIFEKDFIIIPINQKVHWFLAIICFPGLVPEATPKNSSKTTENVTSTDSDAGPCTTPENSQMGIQSTTTPTTTPNKNQACSSTDGDQSSDESLSSELEAGFQAEPLPDVPDSSTHPVRHAQHEKMPCILIFDSLSGPSRWRIVATLREYLDMEWKVKKGTDRDFSKIAMQGHVPNVPQQTNFSDCGVYVLQYVESFFENPFPYYSHHMPQMPNWFPPEKVASKREEIRSLIFELQKRHTPSNNTTVTSKKKDSDQLSCSPSIASVNQINRLTAS